MQSPNAEGGAGTGIHVWDGTPGAGHWEGHRTLGLGSWGILWGGGSVRGDFIGTQDLRAQTQNFSLQGAPNLGLTLLIWVTDPSTGYSQLLELPHEQDLTCTNNPPAASLPGPILPCPWAFLLALFLGGHCLGRRNQSPPAPGAPCGCWDGL